LIVSAVGCRGYVVPPLDPSVFPFQVDSLRSQVIQPGVVRRFVYSPRGPWAMHIFDVDRTRCWTGAALKSAGGAIGREKTSVLARQLSAREEVAGAVNADFFLFTPPGVPTGATISDGRVITGPIEQAVIAFDSTGAPRIDTLRVRGRVSLGGRDLPITGWNRDVRGGLALIDDAWGPRTDTASSVIEIVRIIPPNTSQSGTASSVTPFGQARRPPPTSPPSTRNASGQSMVIGFSGGA